MSAKLQISNFKSNFELIQSYLLKTDGVDIALWRLSLQFTSKQNKTKQNKTKQNKTKPPCPVSLL
jgi:hypothetical protein